MLTVLSFSQAGTRADNDSVCMADRTSAASRLNDIGLSHLEDGKIHHVSAKRAEQTNYDQKAHDGYQGNDQASNHHDYLFTYERLFLGLPRDLTMLNIGVLDGHSLRTFADFFGPRATIVGFDVSLALWHDISARPDGTRPNIETIEGDSTANASWAAVRARYPEGFHLIIDDGCHTTRCMVSTLHNAWPSLREGGVYVGEDAPLNEPPNPFVMGLLQKVHRGVSLKHRHKNYVDAGGRLGQPSAASVETVLFGRMYWMLTKFVPHSWAAKSRGGVLPDDCTERQHPRWRTTCSDCLRKSSCRECMQGGFDCGCSC